MDYSSNQGNQGQGQSGTPGQILHSEKVFRKSTYKNKFQQFQEQQQQELLYGGTPQTNNNQILNNNATGIIINSSAGSAQPSRLSKASKQAPPQGSYKQGMSQFQKEYIGTQEKSKRIMTNTANTITQGTVGSGEHGFDDDDQATRSFQEDKELKTQLKKQAKHAKDVSAKYMSPQVNPQQKKFVSKNFKEDIIDQDLPFQYVDPNMMYRTNQTTAEKKNRRVKQNQSMEHGFKQKSYASNYPSIAGSSDITHGGVMNTSPNIQQRSTEETPGGSRPGLKQGSSMNKVGAKKDYFRTEQRPKMKDSTSNRKVNIFDNTPLHMMPSVNNSGSVIGKTDLKSQLQQNATLGYVNYLNGVPVSIQLEGQGQVTANTPGLKTNTWKQNMNRRNDLLNNNDLNKMHLRNELERNKEGMLPSITSNSVQQTMKKKVKPHYFVNKRKQNYQNIYDEVLANTSQQMGINKNFSASQNLETGEQEADFSNMHNMKTIAGKNIATNPALSPQMGQDLAYERRAESMYVPKRVKKSTSRSKVNADKDVYKNNEDSGYLQAPTVTKNGKMKEYHLSMSQKKPMRTMEKDISREKMPKKKLKKGKNKSNSPKENKAGEHDQEMPYSGKGPINLELGDASDRGKRNISHTGKQTSKSRLDKDSSRFIGVNIQKTFQQVAVDPSLFKIQVQKKHLEHLQEDNLDDISKQEVVYKILKDQLRLHQKRLLQMKQNELKKRIYNKSPKKERNDVNFKQFAKHIKEFEFYGPQRDLSPEIKRIVKNLSCQEHKYLYCPCCKQYEETDYDPIENLQKFMKFIKEEHEKMFPQPKKAREHKRALEMPDDSLSEITDIEDENVMAKYYNEKLSKIEKRKKERASTLKRLRGETVDMKHVCKNINKKNQFNILADNAHEEIVEFELRQRSEGNMMNDEELSAHQFSLKDESIQADSEERMENEMNASRMEDRSNKDAVSPSIRSFHRSATTSVVALSMKSPKKNRDGKIKNTKDTLFNPLKQKCEMSVQTDDEDIQPRKLISKRTMKPGAFESHSRLTQQASEPLKKNVTVDCGTGGDEPYNPDKYKDDWIDSLTYKKAMRSYAIKVGASYGSELDYDEDGEDERLFNNTVYDGKSMFGKDEISDFSSAVEENAQDPNQIGFMKKLGHKGDIKTLTENEVIYTKSILKHDTDNWENKSTLADLFRHCKFTIRKLTRQMANLDNMQLFKKNREPNRENTLVMVYRAERLYSALGDSQKIFKHVSQLIYEKDQFANVYDRSAVQFDDSDKKIVRKRETLIKRIQSQVNNFLGQYRIFDDTFNFKRMPMSEYLGRELHEVMECKEFISQCDKKESVVQMSHRVEDFTSNRKDIVQPAEPLMLQPVPPAAPVPPRIPGPMSPYHSKIQIPDSDSSKYGARGRNHGMRSSSSKKESSHRLKSKQKERQSMRNSKVKVQSGLIEENRQSGKMSLEEAKVQYENLQEGSNALSAVGRGRNMAVGSSQRSPSVDEDGNTIRTKGNDTNQQNAQSIGRSMVMDGNTEDPTSERNPVMIESEADNDAFENNTVRQEDISQNLNEKWERQTQYTMMTAKPKNAGGIVQNHGDNKTTITQSVNVGNATDRSRTPPREQESERTNIQGQ